MKSLETNSLAAVQFELNWQSAEASHTELYYAANVNMWRDIFPPEVEQALLGCREKESFTFTLKQGFAVPEFSESKVLDLAPAQFCTTHVSGHKMTPGFGRFYPSGLLRNVAGIFPQTLAPFRVTGLDKEHIRADLNHPLSRFDLQFTIQIQEIRQTSAERGGRCADWIEEVTQNGPGMQARFQGRQTAFEGKDCYRRRDEGDDSLFYTAPRLVGHIDSQASSLLQDIYSRFLNKGDKVLDLMSSVQSHLPANYGLDTTGLGLNKTELKKNPALNNHLVHDLNALSLLPYSDNSFDAVVCSLSIEYLTNPRAVVNEISRVLVPGGKALIGFSNRWFPPKVTRLWMEIHDFERIGLVLDYLLQNGRFSKLATFSARNWPRPASDRHALEIATSDPVYVVAGTKKLQ